MSQPLILLYSFYLLLPPLLLCPAAANSEQRQACRRVGGRWPSRGKGGGAEGPADGGRDGSKMLGCPAALTAASCAVAELWLA
mgnify:CR=1 FL=1